MTPEQALQLLDQAAGMAPLNRQAHIQVQQAVQVLQALVAATPTQAARDNQPPGEPGATP